MTSAVEDARAGTIDRMATLSGLADVLCPENAIVNMNSIDSLPMSDAATNEKSRRRGDYARVTSELCCALVQFAAGGDEARVKQLVEDVPQQLSWRRLFNGDFGASNYELRRSKHCEGRIQEASFSRIASVRPSETTSSASKCCLYSPCALVVDSLCARLLMRRQGAGSFTFWTQFEYCIARAKAWVGRGEMACSPKSDLAAHRRSM